MKVIFDELAILELDDASEFYELETPGLGARFREEVKKGIRILAIAHGHRRPNYWIDRILDIS